MSKETMEAILFGLYTLAMSSLVSISICSYYDLEDKSSQFKRLTLVICSVTLTFIFYLPAAYKYVLSRL